jgi:hypothetical protein
VSFVNAHLELPFSESGQHTRMRSVIPNRVLRGLLLCLLLIGSGYLLVRWNRSENERTAGSNETEWIVPFWRIHPVLDWKVEVGESVYSVQQFCGYNPFQRHRSSPTDMYLGQQARRHGENYKPYHPNLFVGVTTRVALGSTHFELPGAVWMYMLLLNTVPVVAGIWWLRRRRAHKQMIYARTR